MDEQRKLAHRVAEVEDCSNRKVFATMLQYIVDRPESSSAPVQFLAGKKEEEKIHNTVSVKFEFNEFICRLEVLKSLYAKEIADQPIPIVLKKVVGII